MAPNSTSDKKDLKLNKRNINKEDKEKYYLSDRYCVYEPMGNG